MSELELEQGSGVGSVVGLSDYAAGTWTPIIQSTGGGTPTYDPATHGEYVKIGRLVTASCHVRLATLGTLAAGAVLVGGLPFTANPTVNAFHAATIGYWDNFINPFVLVNGYIVYNTTAIVLGGRPSAGTSQVNILVADISGTTGFIISAAYHTA